MRLFCAHRAKSPPGNGNCSKYSNIHKMPSKKTPPLPSESDDFARLRAQSPMSVFAEWYADAENTGAPHPEAMTLATVSANGRPQARTVLLKEFTDETFVFFTNRESRKGLALAANPRAALLFYWPLLARQVKIEGDTAEISRTHSARYFASRPRQSRIGAWASAQSRPVESPSAFAEKAREIERKFADEEPSLPPHWGGYRLTPLRIEFWREGEHRMHLRLAFERATATDEWQSEFLQP